MVVFEVLLEGVLEVFAHFTGRIIIPVFTLGHCHADSFRSERDWISSQRAWQRIPNGKIIVSPNLSSLVGLLFWVVVVVVLVLTWHFV